MSLTLRNCKAGLGAAALTAFLAVGCQKEADESERIAALLAPVPADTPYLIANLHTIPDDVFRHQMGLFAPRLATILDAADVMVASDQHADQTETMRFRALMAFVATYLRNDANWEQHRMVVYGLDIFPVARVELADPAASLQDLTGLHQKMSVAPEKLSQFSGDLFKVGMEDSGLSLYYGVQGDYLVSAVLPDNASSALMAQAFGGQAPTSALSPETLETMSKERGYSAGLLGFVDTLALYDEFMDQNSAMHAWIGAQVAAHEHVDIDDLSPECRQEYRDLFALMPRAEWGSTRNDKTGFASSAFVQLRPDLAQGLLSMTGDLSGLDQDPGSELAIGASLRIGPMRDFIMQMARNVQAAPFQCEHLYSLNQSAEQILAQAGTPMPPFVGQIRGFKMRMNGLTNMQLMQPPELAVALYVDNAQLLVSMMSLFVPQLAQVELPPDGSTVRLDEVLGDALPFVGASSMFAALTDRSIGVAMGDAEAKVLPTMMKETGTGAGVLFASWLDYGSFVDMQRKMMQDLALEAEMETDEYGSDEVDEYDEWDDSDYEDSDEQDEDSLIVDDSDEGDDVIVMDGDEYEPVNHEELMAFMDATMELYMVLQRAGSIVRPTADGVVIEQSITLKQP